MSALRWRASTILVRNHRAVLAVLLVVHIILLVHSASIHSPVTDEPAHLAAGLSHWTFGDFTLYRVNPPLVRLVAAAPLFVIEHKTAWSNDLRDPARRSEFAVGDDFIRANGSRSFWLTTLSRWACIPFSLIGAIVLYRWAKLLFGKQAGLAAAALWCFSPTILGHASLVTPDAAASALGVAACYAFHRWLISPSYCYAILTGLVLGAAECCKSTWIILFALFPVIWIMFRLTIRGRQWTPTAGQLATILVSGWMVLVSLYGWQGLGEPLGRLPVKSNLFRGMFCEAVHSEYRVRPALAALPLPFPRDYVIGLDQQYDDLEGPDRSFLHAEWRTRGWWYFYLYALLVKEPLGVILLALLSIAWWTTAGCSRCLLRRISDRRFALIKTSGLLLICPLVILFVASANTGMNHHVRYVMPVVPFLYLLAVGLMSRGGGYLVARQCIGCLLIGFAVLSSLLTYPHSLSYFNELAGGPTGGINHLSGSSLDWGQDLLLLQKWKNANSKDEPIYLAYFGRVNPSYAGIDYELPPKMPQSATLEERKAAARGLRPGWYAVSATLLQGRQYMVQPPSGEWTNADENAFSYFQFLVPAGRVGYSIYLFRIDAD